MDKKRAARKPSAKNSKPKPMRANETELALRHVDVASLLLSRYTRGQIAEIGGKKWGVEKTQIDEYIAAAKQLIQDRIAEHKDKRIDEHIDALFDLMQRARAMSDLRLEHDLRKDIAKLLDLYPDAKLKVTDWKSEVVQLLKDGKITQEQLIEVLGDDAREFIVPASETTVPSGTPAEDGDHQKPE